MEPNLRALPDDETGSNTRARREAPRARPSKPLPTDRMKFDVQLRVLQAMSRFGRNRNLDPIRLSQAVNNEVSRHTVGLSNSFFVDCGWLERQGRGEYVITEALADFARHAAANSSKAGEILRSTVSESWFWRLIASQIEHGPVPLAEVMVSLMSEAEVGEQHKPQIKMLLDWLRHLDLIEVRDDQVRLTTSTPDSSGGTTDSAPPVDVPAKHPADSPGDHPGAADSSGQKSTTQPRDRELGAAILAFDFSIRITSEDLARLSPEQIQSLFQGAGQLAAIKAELT